MGTNTALDVDDKLKQYMIINSQISKALSVQRVKIAGMNKTIKRQTSDIINLQLECNKWKVKFKKMSALYISHMHSMSDELRTSTVKFSEISDGVEPGDVNANNLSSLSESSVQNVSRSVDSSRRVSRSFEADKNRSEKGNSIYMEMDTIPEENEQMDDSNNSTDSSSKEESGTDNSNDESSVESDGSSEDSEATIINKEDGDENVDESSGSGEDSNESVLDEDDSGKKSDENAEESGETSEDSEENDSESDEEFVESANKVNAFAVDQTTLISLSTTNYDDDSNKENDTINFKDSTNLQNKSSLSVISVHESQTSRASTPLKSLPVNKTFVDNRSVDNVQDKSSENTFRSVAQSLPSSTPYKNSTVRKNVSQSKPSQSKPSQPSIAVKSKTELNVSHDDDSQTSTTSSSNSRPRRRAAPVILSEPKLNTKLRRPR